jgi:hypothetical protein
MDLPERLQQRIYEWMEVEGMTAGEVATLLSLKEAQVEQVYACFAARPCSSQAELLPPREMARKAWELHDKRLAFLYHTAVSAWQASAEERGVQRRGKNGSVEFVTEVQRGQARYLSVAARLSRERTLAKTAYSKMREQWAAEDAAAGRSPEAIADDARILAPVAFEPAFEVPLEPVLESSATQSPSTDPTTPSEPPASVCARDASPDADATPCLADTVDVNHDSPETCNENPAVVLASEWLQSAGHISFPAQERVAVARAVKRQKTVQKAPEPSPQMTG